MKYQSVTLALAELSSAHPEVVDQERDDSTKNSVWTAAPPVDKNELHQMLTQDLCTAAEALIACEAATSNWEDQNRWDQLAGAVSAVIQDWPALGLDLLEALGRGHPELEKAILRGWTMSRADTELAPQILERIGDLELEPILGSTTAMIGGFGIAGSDPVEWFRFKQSEATAKKCWNTVSPNAISNLSNTNDYAMKAINHPAGHLAEFWVQRIGHLWRLAGDGWTGIPPEIADYLAELLADRNERAEALEIMLCRYVAFLHQADSDWCKQYIFPLLNWDNPSRAKKAWSGFLSHGGWTNNLLADGFLDLLIATSAHTDQLNKQSVRNLIGRLAKIAVVADADPSTWVTDLIADSSVRDRVAWSRAIRFELASLDQEAVERQWSRWIGQYLRERIGGAPRSLDPAEASAIANWLLFLNDSMEGEIELFLAVETAGLALHDLFLHDLGDKQIAKAPEKIARLLHHLLKSTDDQFHQALKIQEIYSQLTDAGVDAKVLLLIAEEATRLRIDVGVL
jgi:hypothetical protein